VVHAAREAGAASIWTELLHLRPGAREHFLGQLARDWPEQLPLYERLYAGRVYLERRRSEEVAERVAELRERQRPVGRRTPVLGPPPAASQLRLAL
jgi:hypothetical protein